MLGSGVSEAAAKLILRPVGRLLDGDCRGSGPLIPAGPVFSAVPFGVLPCRARNAEVAIRTCKHSHGQRPGTEHFLTCHRSTPLIRPLPHENSPDSLSRVKGKGSRTTASTQRLESMSCKHGCQTSLKSRPDGRQLRGSEEGKGRVGHTPLWLGPAADPAAPAEAASPRTPGPGPVAGPGCAGAPPMPLPLPGPACPRSSSGPAMPRQSIVRSSNACLQHLYLKMRHSSSTLQSSNRMQPSDITEVSQAA